MKIIKSVSFFLLTLYMMTISSYALEPLPNNLLTLNSSTGLVLFQKNLNENALGLLSHFETQKTVTYCGVASVVMVLNSTNLAPPADTTHLPYRYFNQDDFFNAAVTNIISPDVVLKKGITLTELTKIIQSYGLHAESYFANDMDINQFRNTLKKAISEHHFIIVNFLRSAIKEQGGGHHSPIAAYDKKTDRFLLLDVARYKYPAYWVKTQDLWNAIHTMDGSTYRGFVIINE